MWLILVASTASTFGAVDRLTGLIVVVKEIYLFAAFVAVASLLGRLSSRDFRLVMLVWLTTVALHGVVILAEFFHPDFYRMISRIGGQVESHEIFRPSGLFFSPKAGNANKAAVFQLLGFVPLVLTKPSRLVSVALGMVLLGSVLATGSMGTTIAFTSGLIVAVVAVATYGKQLALITNFLISAVIAATLIGTVLFFVLGNNPQYQKHFERITVGRAEKSSNGRFSLWERGVGALNEPQVLIWGVGPENFRDVDVLEKQLHNDVLAFAVERGVFGVLGLAMFAGVAFLRALHLLKLSCMDDTHRELTSVIFLAALTAVLVVSLTHQVIHSREIWLVLASQEAVLARLENKTSPAKQATRFRHSRECWGEI